MKETTEICVSEHIPGLRRYARALIGNPTEADDLVQECLCRALTKLKKNAEIHNIKSYLYAVLHNAHVDRLNERRHWNYNIPDQILENRLYSQASQSSRLELRDLADAMEKLPEEQRQTVLLVGYEGLSYKEAAKVLAVPIGTVMSRLSRGREALRRLTNREPMANLRRVN